MLTKPYRIVSVIDPGEVGVYIPTIQDFASRFQKTPNTANSAPQKNSAPQTRKNKNTEFGIPGLGVEFALGAEGAGKKWGGCLYFGAFSYSVPDYLPVVRLGLTSTPN